MTSPSPSGSAPSSAPSASLSSAVVRERGWWRLALAVALALVVPVVPQLRLVVPIEQTVLLVAPAIAACALSAWLIGGRVWMFLAWGGFAAWLLAMSFATGAAGLFAALSRGWALVLAASFATVSVARPRQTFFGRALAAVALSFAVAGAVLLATGVSVSDLGRAIADEFARRITIVMQDIAARGATPEWQQLAQRYPDAVAMVQEGEGRLPVFADFAMTCFPALLALESIALLGVGWSLYHRGSRFRAGAPIQPIASFRFNDQLVWGLILGITILVVPSLRELRMTGINLLFFFGVLYALRGWGVLSWFVAPGRPTPIWMIIASIIAWPFAAVFAVTLGLVDTWIDWRARLRPAP